jgi:hypothetical protein
LIILLFWCQAWYRRGKANVSLGNNRDAIYDLNIAKSVESSTGGKRQVESELKIILDQSKNTNIAVQTQHKENSLSTVGKKLSLLSSWQIGQAFVDCTFVMVISFEVCLKSNILHFEFIMFRYWILSNPLVCLCLSYVQNIYVHNHLLLMPKPINVLQSWKQYVDVKHMWR